jgi:hypothetical protein
MKICLYEDVTFAKDLTYKEACEATEKAGKTPMAKAFRFFIKGQAHTKLWNLCGNPLEAQDIFLSTPEQCIIEIAKEKEKNEAKKG